MKKNPGCRDRRWMGSRNRKDHSDKKMAINERQQMWANKKKHEYAED